MQERHLQTLQSFKTLAKLFIELFYIRNKLCFVVSLNFFQLSVPYFFTLQSFYEIHNTYKDKKERTGKAQQPNKLSAIKFLHWPAQSFRNKVHTWHHNEREKESEDQTKYHRPAKWPPKNNTIATKENMRIKVLKKGNKIDIKTNSKRQ